MSLSTYARVASLIAFQQARAMGTGVNATGGATTGGADCGRDPDGKFGSGNKCAGEGGPSQEGRPTPSWAEDIEHTMKRSKGFDDPANKQAWLNPSGVFYPVSGDHGEFAKSHGVDGGGDDLLDAGWLRVAGVDSDTLYAGNSSGFLPKRPQLLALKDFAISIGKKRVLFDDGKARRGRTIWQSDESRAFCPTGDGGGVDNSCGGSSSAANVSNPHNNKSWIDLSGVFHPMGGVSGMYREEHEEWAESQAETIGSLFRKGWGRVNKIGDTVWVQSDGGRTPAGKQLSSLIDYAIFSNATQVVFDPGSGSKKKVLWDRSEDRAFCPTGESGGVDNSCSAYQGNHKPPSDTNGAPAHDLGRLLPEDVYSKDAGRLYGHGDRHLDEKTASIIRGLKGNPEKPVQIYRAVPKSAGASINPGDWVTINKDYAKQHGDSTLRGDYKIVSKTVKAKEIFTNGDSIHEWGYKPDDGKSRRAFCPTGEGGGVDNSCAAGGASTKASSVASQRASKAIKDVVGKVKSGASVAEIQAEIERAVVGKSGFFGGYTPGDVSAAEMCKALGLKVQNADSLDDLLASSWGYERVGIAASIAQLAAVSAAHPQLLRGVDIRIDTTQSAADHNEMHWSEFDNVAGSYFPGTDVVHLIAGGISHGEEMANRMYESGYLSVPDDVGTMVHELAHRSHYKEIERQTGLKSPRGGSESSQAAFLKKTQDAAYDSLISETLKDPEWKSRFVSKAKDISFYATTDPFELVAEYTTAVQLGRKENDKDLDRFCKAILAPVPKRLKK